MITKTKAYTSSDGAVHASIELAQRHELGILFADAGHPLIESVVAKRCEVVNILTMTDASHPRARNINGAKRKPRAKAASPEQVKNGLAGCY